MLALKLQQEGESNSTTGGRIPKDSCRQGCVQASVHSAADIVNSDVAIVSIIHSKEVDFGSSPVDK